MSFIPRSSFLPKETPGAIPVQIKKRHTVHVFGLIGSIMFVGSLLASGGVFFYKDYLNKNLLIAQEALNTVSNESNEGKIEEIRSYDNRLRVADDLLRNHVAPSILFDEIEKSTKRTVQFDSFEYTYDPGFEVTLSLSGKTKEFSSVAVQKMQFFDDSLFNIFVVRDISISEKKNEKDDIDAEPIRDSGVVSFIVTGLFKKDLLRYSGEDLATRDTTNHIFGILPDESSDLVTETTIASSSPTDTYNEKTPS